MDATLALLLKAAGIIALFLLSVFTIIEINITLKNPKAIKINYIF